MARAKRRSDVLNNQRKQVKRIIANITKQVNSGRIGNNVAAENYLNFLRQQLAATYVGRTRNVARREAAYARAENNLSNLRREVVQSRSVKARKVYRINRIFENEMRLASMNKNSSLGDFGREKVKIFFRATQNFWDRRGISAQNRLQAVMNAMGETDLSVAFDKVLAANPEALAAVREAANVSRTSTEGMVSDIAQGNGHSPIYMHMVRVMSNVIRA